MCLEFENPIIDAVTRVRFAPRSDNLLISSWDCRIRLYDARSSTLRLEASTDAAHIDCCFRDELVAFSAASDGLIYRHDLQSATQFAIGSHDDLASCIEHSEVTCQLVTAGWDRKLIFWDYKAPTALHSSMQLCNDVESISLCGLQLYVATGMCVNVYDLRKLDTSTDAHTFPLDITIKSLCYSPHTEGFAAGSVDGRVKVEFPYPSSSDQMGYTFRCHPKSKNGKHHPMTINDIAFDPRAHGAFVTGDSDGYVIGWNARSRRRLFELPQHSNSIASLSYNYTGELLAVASSYMYQEANEREDPPQIFIHELGDM